ncbi:MAG: prolyl oligopeptidase family serine peptidase [Planctomycetota bacterium]
MLTFSLIAAAQTAQPKTINLDISPVWINDHILRYRIEDRDGSAIWKQIDASTGIETAMDRKLETEDDLSLVGGLAAASKQGGDAMHLKFENKTQQRVTILWIDTLGERHEYATIKPGKSHRQHTYVGHAWEAVGKDGAYYGNLFARFASKPVTISKAFNRGTRERQKRADGGSSNHDQSSSRGVRYFERRFQIREDLDATWHDLDARGWQHNDDRQLIGLSMSPDGQVIAGWLKKHVAVAETHTIESSPKGGGRARLHSRPYRLPGDAMDEYELLLIDKQTGERIELPVPVIDFGRPTIRWRSKHELMFEKIDRGHQRFRLFVINPLTQTARTAIDETSDTFIWTNHRAGCPIVSYLENNDEVIHASEKDGYRHLYLVDLNGVQPTRTITSGDFLVRQILHVDETERYADLVVGEFADEQDPYHRHLLRVSLDEDRAVALTQSDGDHQGLFSPRRDYVVVTHSRVDSPPVHELRHTDNGDLIQVLAKSETLGDPLNLPLRFSAKGRDGTTDIWGIICFPPDLNPDRARGYPVLESIYAGPHGSHVPKLFRPRPRHQELTKAGFIVVQIDGMGTANRSKAFHDVCWHNLKDAGFPDRIAWLRAAARKYPAMDLNRVGIFGTSAGGQNACGALLFHGDFYKAAMASCGCHDNRMDKASWNEQWMGYLVGPHYAESSNIEHADQLRGDLLLLVGELDRNVPPESTFRLVDALIKADKRFEFLMLPGVGHSNGGPYGQRLMRDFFVRKLSPEPAASRSDARLQLR